MDFSRRLLFRGRVKAASSVQQPNVNMPWAVSSEVFLDQCTRCGKCAEACPEQVIIKGDGGFPSVDFNLGECTFCGECSAVCNEPIFKKLSERPWNQIAVINDADDATAVSLEGACMVQKGIVCQSCKDVCDVRAITMKYNSASMPEPIIGSDLCTGCGACVSVCPTSAINICDMTPKSNQSGGEEQNYAIA